MIEKMEMSVPKKWAWYMLAALIVALLLFCKGCASQAQTRQGDIAPVAQAQQSQVYFCPKGPKVFERGYYSDLNHNSEFGHLVENTWKVSPDGSSGSMSQTFIRTYEHTTKGEHGTIVGPAGFGRYGGY